MHHRAAGEIERADFHEPAIAPDPMRDRNIDDGQPQHDEQDECAKAHPVHHGSRDQCDGNHREGHLICGEQQFRNIRRERRCGVRTDAAEQSTGKRADKGSIARKSQAVAEQEPQDGADAYREQCLRHGRQHVLLAHHSAVKQSQSGNTHHQHEAGRRDHPGGISGVDGRVRRHGKCRAWNEQDCRRGRDHEPRKPRPKRA
jgi:hypothetical protein